MKVVLLALVTAVASGSAWAQFAKPEDAVEYRQAAFELMGNHAGRINAQLKSATPNVQAIQSSANILEFISKLPFEAFVPGSEKVGNTKTKPAAFTDTARFKELTEKMQAETSKLAAVAKQGDVAAIRTQFGAVGQSCKGCHDDYKSK